jgi:hypothetical protein
MAKIQEELVRLQRFCEMVAGTLLAAAPPADPSRAELLSVIANLKSRSAARTLVRDLLEWSQDIRDKDLVELDQRLGAQALPSLSLMRSREDGDFAGILQRGFVSTEGEYQLVNARLADTAAPITSADRALAESLLAAFTR